MAARKKKAWGWRLGGIALLLMGAMALAYWLSHRYFRPSFVHYAQFGISIPTNYSIHGIDVSKHQQTIAWEEVQRINGRFEREGWRPIVLLAEHQEAIDSPIRVATSRSLRTLPAAMP